MRALPKLDTADAQGTSRVITFGGINRSSYWSSGELRDSYGITAERYPYMTQRKGRAQAGSYQNINGVCGGDKVALVAGSRFYYDDAYIGTAPLSDADYQRMAVINTKVVMWPAKKYYDMTTGELGSLEATLTTDGIKFTKSTIESTSAKQFPFKAGDAIEISGDNLGVNAKSTIIREVSEDMCTLTFDSDTFAEEAHEGDVTFTRSVPDLDYICEYNNRIWGCANNTIYASKLGDPTNFNVFDGLASDSYTVAVGSPGAFTGCIAYGSHICFFKEDLVHKMYGTKPANYQLSTYKIAGVKDGSSRSLCIINETLFYHGREGVYAYSGGVPELISEGFGARRYSSACAGADGRRYWISLSYTDGAETKADLMVYDAMNGIWLRDSDTAATGFAFSSGALYMVSGGKLYQLDTEAENVDWMAEFDPFEEGTEAKKALSRISLSFRQEGWMKIEIKYDDEAWQEVFTTRKGGLINVPIPVQRCDSFRIRLSGHGKITVTSMTRQVASGSSY